MVLQNTLKARPIEMLDHSKSLYKDRARSQVILRILSLDALPPSSFQDKEKESQGRNAASLDYVLLVAESSKLAGYTTPQGSWGPMPAEGRMKTDILDPTCSHPSTLRISRLNSNLPKCPLLDTYQLFRNSTQTVVSSIRQVWLKPRTS